MTARFALLSLLLAVGSHETSPPAASPPAAPVDSCATVPACEARLRALAVRAAGGYNEVERELSALSRRFAAMPEAEARLVELLDDPQPRVATLAGSVLRNDPEIDPARLPGIVAAIERGDRWVTPALARIPGDEAAALIVAYFLASESAPGNQEAHAVRQLGPRALPHLIAAARCDGGCAPRTHELLAAVLPRDAESAAAAAPELLLIAADPAAAESTAKGSLQMISALGPAAAEVAPALLELRTTRPALAPEIDAAMVALEVPAGVDVLAAHLADPDVDPTDLFRIAMMGARARAAAPAVLRLLDRDGEDRRAVDVRVIAVRTLGLLDYPAAIPRLRTALSDPRDVNLQMAAAIALGQLLAGEARPELAAMARSHWYPPARAAATAALANLDAGVPGSIPTDPAANQQARFELLGMWNEVPLASCHADVARAAIDPGVVLRAADPAQRESLAALAEHRTTVHRTPSVALRVPGGWLTGRDDGEFGGELMFLPDDGGAAQPLRDDNVQGLFLLGSRAVAVTGLAHMGYNRGMVLSIDRGADGRWHAAPWRALPAAPGTAEPTTRGELLIDTIGRGSVLLAADGTMRMAPCKDGDDS